MAVDRDQVMKVLAGVAHPGGGDLVSRDLIADSIELVARGYLFDAVVAMTQGGPGTASDVPAKFIMDHLFGRANLALASAGAIVLLATVLALVAPILYARQRGGRA